MAEAQPTPRWKRRCSLAFRIYAALCTLLVTAYIALCLWAALFAKSTARATSNGQALFIASHKLYMANEYPKRGYCFHSMAGAFRSYVSESPVLEADLYRYFGKPDQWYVTNEVVNRPGQSAVTNKIVAMAYLFDFPGAANKWSATAILLEGKVADIAFNDSILNHPSGFQEYPTDPVPNKQGGANGRQPLSTETNRASAAAASRRSP
jgi:hypothetical protein